METMKTPEETKLYRLHHAMLRVVDPEKSKHFYCDLMGMKFLTQFDFPDAKFSLLFFAYTDEEPPDPSLDINTRFAWVFSRPYNTLELTHNWGFNGKYHSGNEDEHKGFGHICIVVPDIYKCCERLEKSGVTIQRKPGPMQNSVHLAFVLDPDGYWVELIPDQSIMNK